MLNRKQIECDFCVIGGGIAGMCAAISAARKGLKVVMMHERPVLGGNASSEIRMWVCGSMGENNRETGIIEEIILENLYRNPTKNFYIWDTVLYDFIRREKNITLLLNCTCLDAACENGNYKYGRNIKIKTVTGYQLTTQTYIDVKAKYYADCSGDSILAPLTDAEFMLGRESKDEFNEDTHIEKSDKMTMGMSCLIQGRETNRDISFIPPSFAKKLEKSDFENRNPNIYCTGENFWYLELGGDRDSIHDTEDIAHELRALAIGTWDYVKNSGTQKADKWELEFMGFLPGKRESRRMTGEYVLTQKDISNGTVFEDTAAFGGWPLDDHFPGGFYHRGTPNTNFKTEYPYTIPYRCMYSKNVDNLFFAGRNISATHFAMSSTRVMATCGVIGQAVGTAAAIAFDNNETPNDVYINHINLLQQTLMNDDCFLPHFKRNISKLCENSSVNQRLYDGCDRFHKIYGADRCGICVENGREIKYKFNDAKNIKSIHIVFDSDLNRNTLPGDGFENYHSMRCNVLLDSPQFHMPKTLCREFKVIIYNGDNCEELLHVTENRKRSYHLKTDREITAVGLIPVSNWGDIENTDVFSFDIQ